MLQDFPRARVTLYILSVLASAAAFIVAIYDSELAAAMTAAASSLAIASGAVALGNVPRSEP